MRSFKVKLVRVSLPAPSPIPGPGAVDWLSLIVATSNGAGAGGWAKVAPAVAQAKSTIARTLRRFMPLDPRLTFYRKVHRTRDEAQLMRPMMERDCIGDPLPAGDFHSRPQDHAGEFAGAIRPLHHLAL